MQGEALWIPGDSVQQRALERVLLSLGDKGGKGIGSEVESGCYVSIKLLEP